MARYGQLQAAVAPLGAMDDDVITFAPQSDDGAALRHAFGRFGTGVTVVTVDTPMGPIGMTANSFSSISLDPPLVLWSPALRSQRHDAFVQASHFCIHVLGDNQQPLADHFARNGDGFDRFDWTAGDQGTPHLAGCLAAFQCETFAVHPAGDHSIVLGKVTEVTERRGKGAGLMFDQGRFGRFQPNS
ncbi:flavin reductase family protein [Sulfitobacter mediterraneus]|uniref:flavin reductase family protein n=1 Tax=Sulfitobacter mediterraneus TaxID=83219 RepID=UPI002ED916AA